MSKFFSTFSVVKKFIQNGRHGRHLGYFGSKFNRVLVYPQGYVPIKFEQPALNISRVIALTSFISTAADAADADAAAEPGQNQYISDFV